MMHTSDRDSTDAPYGLTANDRPIPGGFTGTIPAFLDWLEEHLAYGGVGVSDPQPAEFMPQRMVRKVSLVTGGYSDDEALLGRVSRGLFGMSYWESSHRGGLTVYEVPVASFDSAKEYEWLAAPTDVFERLHRVRTIVVQDVAGDTVFEIPVEHGAVLAFSEPDRDTIEPVGLLTVSPIPEKDSVWAQLKLANDRGSAEVDAVPEELAD